MRYVLCLGLFLAGYLLGTVELPTHAQNSGFYLGADGEFGTVHTPTPGGPSYLYGADGTLGTIVPTTPPVMDFSMPKSPC